MSQPSTAEPAIMGYAAIAKAVTVAIKQSVSIRTAKRYAKHGHDTRPRLPVCIYPNGRAYLLPLDLEVWARAWLARRPSGARAPGSRPGTTCPSVAPQVALAA